MKSRSAASELSLQGYRPARVLWRLAISWREL